MKYIHTTVLVICFLVLLTACTTTPAQRERCGESTLVEPTDEIVGSRVSFNEEGTAIVNGKPFFPVGIFTYELNSDIMADIHELQFNTIIHGFNTDQLDMIRDHGLMALCYTGDEWFAAAHEHPALLGWYLTDEPESHGFSPEQMRDMYLALKEKDPHHPIGLCHYLFEALDRFKDACDFTMTDVYPITRNRDVPVVNVGIHMDEARRVHGPNWPNWTYIQDFGGPETDGGKWAQPLPHEVRCMTYIALVHRANGILYFSYWPRAPRTWESIKDLNIELHQIIPWLVAEGRELGVRSEAPEVQVRARQVDGGGIVMAVNTSPRFVDTEIAVDVEESFTLRELASQRTTALEKGTMRVRLAPFEAKAFTCGETPSVELANM